MAGLAFDDLIPTTGGDPVSSLSFDDLIKPAAAKPKGYVEARAKFSGNEALSRGVNERFLGKRLGGLMTAGNDWQAQVARNTGAMDEVAGGISYMTQGGENLVRRMTGAPVEIPAAVAARAAMDHEREAQARYSRDHPVGNAVAAAASMATSARPTGGSLMTSPLKAAAAATAQNAPFALARQEGTLKERLPGALKEEALVAGTAGLMTAGGNMLARSGAKARAAPRSNARTLSDAGVRLTPGQMVGGLAQRVEDAATSLPMTGASINAARTRGMEDFNRAAIDRSLAQVGERLPAGVEVGREGVKTANDIVSGAYKTALNGVTVAPDAQLATDLAAVKATPNLPPAVRAELDSVVGDIEARFAGAIDGPAWKAIDADLGKMSRAADRAAASQPGATYLKKAIDQLRDAHFAQLERINPGAAEAVAKADAATANLIRVRKASQGASTSQRGGVFTPGELNRAVARGDSSGRQFSQGTALMQDLTDPAMQVLPSKVPDSGTALRLMTAGGVYGGATAALGPHTAALGAALDAAGAIAYSPPVQAAINAVYRATSPGQIRAAIGTFEQLAARNPALLPILKQLIEGPSAGERPVTVSGQ